MNSPIDPATDLGPKALKIALRPVAPPVERFLEGRIARMLEPERLGVRMLLNELENDKVRTYFLKGVANLRFEIEAGLLNLSEAGPLVCGGRPYLVTRTGSGSKMRFRVSFDLPPSPPVGAAD